MPKGHVSGTPNELPSVGEEYRILRTPNQPEIVIVAVRYDDHRKEHRISYRFKADRGPGGKMNGSCWYESGFRRPSCYAPVNGQHVAPVSSDAEPKRVTVDIDMAPVAKALARMSGDVALLEQRLDRLISLAEEQIELLAKIGQAWI